MKTLTLSLLTIFFFFDSSAWGVSTVFPNDKPFFERIFHTGQLKGTEWDSIVNLGGCTGVFIDNQSLLTAAHCLKLNNIGDHFIKVYFGYRKKRARSFAIRHKEVHPTYLEYSSQFKLKDRRKAVGNYDVAIIILDEPIKLKIKFFPLLASEKLIHETLPVNSEGRVIGFGASTKNSNGQGYGRRRFADLNISKYISDMVVMSRPGGASCSGDSGGPVLIQHNNKWHLFATIVGGSTHGCQGSNPVFSHVLSNSIDWIQAVRSKYLPEKEPLATL